MSDNRILLSFVFVVIISVIILVWWYSDVLKSRMDWFAGNFYLWRTGHLVEKTPTTPMMDYWPRATKEPAANLPTHAHHLAAILFGVTIFTIGLSFACNLFLRQARKRVKYDDHNIPK